MNQKHPDAQNPINPPIKQDEVIKSNQNHPIEQTNQQSRPARD